MKAKAKEAFSKIDKDWLNQAKEKALSIRGTSGERNPRIDLRKLGGTQKDPAVLQVEFLTMPKTVQTPNMKSPMDVVDVKVLQSSKPDFAEPGETYSIWANTKALRDNFKKIKLGATFIVASHGKVKTQSNNDFYVLNFIEEA